MNLKLYSIRIAISLTLFLSINEVFSQHAVDAAMRSPHNGEIYLFRGEQYLRVDPGTMIVDPNYPKNISEGWSTDFPSGWEGNWDAITPFGFSDLVWIFKGNNFLRFNTETKEVFGPFSINLSFNFPPSFDGIRAAQFDGSDINAPTVYFYDSDQSFALDVLTNTITNVSSIESFLFYSFFGGVDAVFTNNDEINTIRGTQVSSFWAPGQTLSFQNINIAIGNWSWFYAVQNVVNGAINQDIEISDNKCSPLQRIPVSVSNLNFGSNILGETRQLESISFQITHPNISDLTIRLISPQGSSVTLVSGVGGSGDNFGTSPDFPTTFSLTSTTPISSGTAPFWGDFQPEESLTNLLDGSDAEDLWLLEVCDNVDNNRGTIEFINLDISAYSPLSNTTQDISSNIGLYPIPARTSLNIDAPDFRGNTTIRIFEITGKEVLKSNFKDISGGNVSLDVSTLPRGIYVLQMSDGERNVQKRFTKF